MAANMRVKIAFLEEKISIHQKDFFYFCHSAFAFSTIFFLLVFAVQPLDHETFIVHTLPFSFHILGMVFNQVSTHLFLPENLTYNLYLLVPFLEHRA